MLTYIYLALEICLVAGIVLALFRLRHRLGLGPLFVFIGSNQYLQTVLASSVYFDLPSGGSASPGSAVLFTSSLFAILLIYLCEDVPRTRTLIYGILVANVTLTLLSWITSHQLGVLPTSNVAGRPEFIIDARVFLVGTVSLLLDSLLIVVVYEFLFLKARRIPLLPRLVVALLLVVWFDSVVFAAGGFAEKLGFKEVLLGQLEAKSFAAVIYATLLWAYLVGVEWRGERPEWSQERRDRDLFSIVTFRRRFAAMRHQLADAEAESRSKSRFLAHMSHELRTPLTAIIGFTGVLLKNKGLTLTREDLLFVARIRENGIHLLDLINGLLDLTRIEAGRMELTPSRFDLGEVVAETLAQLEGQALVKHLTIAADLPPRSLEIEADRSALKLVLINLVGNALKFTDKGQIVVRVVADPGGEHPQRLEVTDTGRGIPEDQLERIFEAFEQADDTDQRQGTGLGLALSRALCAKMGYALEVRSKRGAGSTFSVVFG